MQIQIGLDYINFSSVTKWGIKEASNGWWFYIEVNKDETIFSKKFQTFDDATNYCQPIFQCISDDGKIAILELNYAE